MGSLLDPVFDVISGGKDKAATRAQADAVRQLQGLQTPAIADMRVQLEELVLQGQLTPQQAEAILQEQSGMENIATDPQLKNAQLQALSQLQEIGSSGGLTAMDRAQLSELTGNLANQERGQRESIMQSAQQRGMGGSGLALAQQMQNQQGSAQRASQQGLDIAALAQQRALESIMQSGQLGGQIRGQDFNEQAQKAQAQDMINQFNAQARQNTQNQNVDRMNQAQQYNLGQRQSVADANVATRNQQQQYNKNLYQQDFENRYKKAGGTANALQSQAQTLGQQGADRRALVGGVTETIFGAKK